MISTTTTYRGFIPRLLLLFCCALLSACSGQEQFLYAPMKYATLLRSYQGEGWTGIEVMDAWHERQVLHRYILVPRASALPDNLPEGTLIRTPLERTAVLSSVHGGLFCDLGCADRMAGLCDVSYVQSDSLRQRLADGRLADIGSSMSVAPERLIALRPDAIFVSPFENAGYGVLTSLSVPLIECADYMESSALGRAEWMKFYGRLMGADAEADSLFAEVERNYLRLSEKVRETSHRPSLLCDLKQGSAWYVPGGNSYIGRLFADAGADYLFADHGESGSVALSFESVLAKGREADIWVIKYGRSTPHTYQTLAADFPLNTHFSAWKTRQIYGCNTFSSPFYEEIPFHPDRLLYDMVKIFHPALLPDYELHYYLPLSELAP